jgi:DNA-directed RNA polymerase specialized sigma24 family protein
MRRESSQQKSIGVRKAKDAKDADPQLRAANSNGDSAQLLLEEQSGTSEDHRTVLELYYLDGLGCEAIAKKLDIPKGTVHTRSIGS